MGYINLRTFTDFSEGVGVGKPDAYIKKAKELGHAGIAITDHGTLGAAIPMWSQAKDAKLPSVLGCNIFLAENIKHRVMDNRYTRLMLFAKNEKGFKKISAMISKASLPENFYYRPRVDMNELLNNAGDIVVSSGCASSIFAKHIKDETGKEEEILLKFKEAFKDDFYIELVQVDLSMKWSESAKEFLDEGVNFQEVVNQRMLELAKKHAIKYYISAPAYMPEESLKIVQDIVIDSIRGNAYHPFPKALFLMSEDDVLATSRAISPFMTEEELKQGMNETLNILDKCKKVAFDFRPIIPETDPQKHPSFQKKDVREKLADLGSKYKDRYLGYLINDVSKRDDRLLLTFLIMIDYGKVNFDEEVIVNRVEEELRVIQMNGLIKLPAYFHLIDKLIIDVMKKEDDLGQIHEKGYGRGSSAASLVNYALDITDVDPIKFNLNFKRFQSLQRTGTRKCDLEEVPRDLVMNLPDED